MTSYRCPACKGALAEEEGSLICGRCAVVYPVRDSIADFSRGSYYDQFDDSTLLTEEQQRGLELENEGAVARIAGYYLPRIAAESRPGARVLDAGCGSGISVDLLHEGGWNGWGIDLSALRRWQWRGRTHRDHLAVADGARLPFAGGFFDVVLCSGVIEHIGVAESGGEAYAVSPLPGRDAARKAFVAELLRVVKPGGVLYLDFPNGAFPIDFWHNVRAGSARFHSRSEGFLPTVGEIRPLVGAAASVTPVSPNGRLRFRQVRRHWYGRLFSLPMQALFGLMDVVPALSGTALNPYLVLRIVKAC